jgi:hypothetical protein
MLAALEEIFQRNSVFSSLVMPSGKDTLGCVQALKLKVLWICPIVYLIC